ncbi:MAG: hypothetical protein KAI43_05310 [Candidatus Aureabacteria bacterium]|nr:hypothetical protein [Candidatus Auribacterota bacterium]
MLNKIISICTTVVFTDIFLNLIQNDNISEFIPFLNSISRRHFHISAYDFFLVITILILRILYIHFGINRSVFRILSNLISHLKLIEIIILIVSCILTHFFIWPFIYQIFSEPINSIYSSPDSIKKTVIMALPFIWLLIITLINKGNSYSYNAQPPTQAMPTPPTW